MKDKLPPVEVCGTAGKPLLLPWRFHEPIRQQVTGRRASRTSTWRSSWSSLSGSWGPWRRRCQPMGAQGGRSSWSSTPTKRCAPWCWASSTRWRRFGGNSGQTRRATLTQTRVHRRRRRRRLIWTLRTSARAKRRRRDTRGERRSWRGHTRRRNANWRRGSRLPRTCWR